MQFININKFGITENPILISPFVNAYIKNTFLPNDISGLMVWLDANNVNGTNVQPSDGSSLSLWKDLSGNSNNYVQNTGSRQPIFNTAQLPVSSSAINFNGSKYMTGPLISTIIFTIFVVYKTINTGTNQIIYFNGDSGINGYGPAVFSSNYAILEGGVVWNEYLSANTNYNMHQVSWNGSTIYTLVNGTIYPVLNPNQGPNFPSLSSSIGSDSGGTGSFFQGSIAEIIFYNKILNASENSSINTYFQTKYGL
jgi:hypothetical protein